MPLNLDESLMVDILQKIVSQRFEKEKRREEKRKMSLEF